MRHINEIYNLPVSQLSDEEILKAAAKRLGSKMVALIYKGDDDTTYTLWRFSDKEGRRYWNRIETNIMIMWQKLTLKIKDRYWRH